MRPPTGRTNDYTADEQKIVARFLTQLRNFKELEAYYYPKKKSVRFHRASDSPRRVVSGRYIGTFKHPYPGKLLIAALRKMIGERQLTWRCFSCGKQDLGWMRHQGFYVLEEQGSPHTCRQRDPIHKRMEN